MTLEQLRIFVAVAEREHVTKAAQALNLTQSAVSAAVSALEARHATRLFDRIGRRIELTDAGRAFLVEARAVLARAASAETVLADFAGLKRGSLSVAASQTVANYWLPPLLARYRTSYPGISVQLLIGNTQQVAHMVHEGIADLGYIEGSIDDPALSVVEVAEDEMALVASPAFPGLPQGRPTAEALAALPFVFREPGSGTRELCEQALKAMGLDPRALNIVLELPSNEAVRAAVEGGAGVAGLSRLVVAGALNSGLLTALALPLPKRAFYALRHKERTRTRAEEAFDALIAQARPRPKSKRR